MIILYNNKDDTKRSLSDYIGHFSIVLLILFIIAIVLSKIFYLLDFTHIFAYLIVIYFTFIILKYVMHILTNTTIIL